MVSYSDLDLRNSRIYVTNYNLRRGSLVIGFVVTVLAVAGTYSLIQSSIDALKNSLQLHFTRLDLHFVKIEFEERKTTFVFNAHKKKKKRKRIGLSNSIIRMIYTFLVVLLSTFITIEVTRYNDEKNFDEERERMEQLEQVVDRNLDEHQKELQLLLESHKEPIPIERRINEPIGK